MKKRVLSLMLAVFLLVGLLPCLTTQANADVIRYWPVPGHTDKSRGFTFGRHEALDIQDASVNGATVIACVGGTVCTYYRCDQQHYGNEHKGVCNGFGNGIIIKGDDGLYYQYAHMQAGSMPSYVYYGARIEAGQMVGRVGTTGNSSGPHLHFQISKNTQYWVAGVGNNIDPLTLTYNYSTPGASYENLGEDFYAYIKFPTTGHGVCNVGSNVQLGTYGSQESLWHFIRQSNGSYKILSTVDGKAMDIYNNNTANETNLQTWEDNNTTAQRFYIQKAGSNYNLIAANSGKAVDVRDGANSTAGTNIHIFSLSGKVDQQFEINIKPTQKNGWEKESGKWYYYKDDVKATSQWVQDNGQWYYVDASGCMVTGFYIIDKKLNLFNAGGVWQGTVACSNWLQLGGKWYYFKSGVMQTGWLQSGGKWYYLSSSGVMQTGWVQVSGKWYYMNSSGVMQTGWVQVSGKWYYMNSSGVMQTGWLQSGGKWYYLQSDGKMATGWVKDGGKYYYMGSSGVMQTGWVKVGNEWYYMNSNGTMYTGWLQQGGKTYYLLADGSMLVGWGKGQSGNWYYFYADGTMATGNVKIDGQWYTFAPNGVLQ